ncbi:hypothetical protein BGZ93_009499 [Podila epicladia]|nr:hypothetical protein BGZ93_009499 [Podila epicladia]
MGVKTLRKKFQMAGSVVATVGWWQHLKQNSAGEPSPGGGKPLTPMRTFSKKKKLPLEKIFTDAIPEAVSELSPNETRHLHAPPVHEVNPITGLRSPPLTPKGPLSGSSLLVGLNHDSKGDMSVLPVIPDNDIEVATLTIAMMATPSFPLDAMLEKTPGATNVNETKGIGFTEEEPPVPVPALLSVFAPPSLPSPSSGPALSEEVDIVETTVKEPEPEPEPELNESNAASENAHSAQEDDKDEEELVIQKSKEHGLKTKSTPASSPKVTPELISLIEDAELSSVEEASFAEMVAEMVAEDQDKVEQNGLDKDSQDKPSITSTSTSTPTQEGPDTWVQAFWRFLIRIEYFVLGTAVLGAMMPDNVYALCAGFFSALVYASLLIYHRIAAPPGSEAPKPPTGTHRRVVVVSPSGSQSRRSSRYRASLNSTSIKTE